MIKIYDLLLHHYLAQTTRVAKCRQLNAHPNKLRVF